MPSCEREREINDLSLINRRTILGIVSLVFTEVLYLLVKDRHLSKGNKGKGRQLYLVRALIN